MNKATEAKAANQQVVPTQTPATPVDGQDDPVEEDDPVTSNNPAPCTMDNPCIVDWNAMENKVEESSRSVPAATLRGRS